MFIVEKWALNRWMPEGTSKYESRANELVDLRISEGGAQEDRTFWRILEKTKEGTFPVGTAEYLEWLGERPAVGYLYVISAGPLIIIRIPWPAPAFKDILNALGLVMESHGYKKKDIIDTEWVAPSPDVPWLEGDEESFSNVERAFSGDLTLYPNVWLYDWKDGEFLLVREPS